MVTHRYQPRLGSTNLSLARVTGGTNYAVADFPYERKIMLSETHSNNQTTCNGHNYPSQPDYEKIVIHMPIMPLRLLYTLQIRPVEW